MFLPSSTYRVQLHKEYTFQDLKKIIPYLHELGISSVYASPITTATSGSMHGYDVTNPDIINPEIGTEEEFAEIIQQLNEHNMSWLQDIVPNHMAYSPSNTRLMDVFERGENSPYYNYFDIDWDHWDDKLKGRVMNPILGNDIEECLDNKEIKIQFDNDGLHIAYYDNVFPASVHSYTNVLAVLRDKRTNELTELETQVQEMLLKAETTGFNAWDEFKRTWSDFIFYHEAYKKQIDKAIEKINSDKQLLQSFLEQQNFVFTNWRLSDNEMNYRRFFTVNSLICLRMEDEFVFNDYHKLLKRLYDKGYIKGLRIDHIDGLYNPKQYVERLRKLFGEDCYIIAEKILEYNENMAQDWNLQGTSGYEFLSYTNQLLTDKEGSKKILEHYKKLVSGNEDYHDMVFEKKQNFLYSQMNGELDNILRYGEELKVFEEEGKLNREKMRKAIGTFMSAFPVYRVYIDCFPVSDESMEFIKKAFEKAFQKASDINNELNVLKNIFETKANDTNTNNKLLFVMRLMQFTSPLAAKGVEDTTFYVYNPLISHNEVGDSPAILGISVEDFHKKMISRKQNNPYSLNATSTHDTKRGEDARMRLNALSEIPDEWIKCVEDWHQKNKSLLQSINNKPAPSANDEYFIYQSLIGSFPEDLKVTDAYIKRSHNFIQKALREAKVETNYPEPNTAYENACKKFITALLKNENDFLNNFSPFVDKLIDYGTVYSMVQVLIKATVPGIPDTYQGCELWDLSYVDPDNRRPIDFECRKEILNEITNKKNETEVLDYITKQKKEGREKLFVTEKVLKFRRENNELFANGEYIPLNITNGERKVVAYARKQNDKWVIAILPVAIVNKLNKAKSLLDKNIWENIALALPPDAPKKWTNIFTNESIERNETLPLENVFTKFSLALLFSF